MLAPINFKKWIDENRHLLRPPIGNQQIWQDREFMVTVVGGPNSRQDYHVNQGEEFFHQIEGEMILKVIDQGVRKDIPIREGEIFLLPARMPHSPQRSAGTIGLVLERKRLPNEDDAFLWFCEKCGKKLHEENLHLTDIVTQLPPVLERFYGNPAHLRCDSCGWEASQ